MEWRIGVNKVEEEFEFFQKPFEKSKNKNKKVLIDSNSNIIEIKSK